MENTSDNYHKIIDGIEDYAILLLDDKGTVKDWNKGAEKLKGYKAEEIIGKNFRLFYTKEDNEKGLPEKLIKCAAVNGKATDEGWRLRKDGSRFWGSILITALHDEKNKLTGFLKITRDLTERKSVEEKLKQANEELELRVKERTEKLAASEKQFRYTLDNMLEGIQIHDFNWRYIYVNDALVKNSSYTRREELMGYTLMEKYPGIEQTEVFAKFRRCMEQRIPEQFETEFTFPNGTRGWFDLSVQPVPEGIFILSVDITERKKAEEELIKSNRLYAFISGINQSIVHINDERELLGKACKIATEIGQFKMAWIGLLDESNRLNTVSAAGDKGAIEVMRKYSGMNYDIPLMRDTTTGLALGTGRYSRSNNSQSNPNTQLWNENFLAKHSIKSNIAFPLKKFGKVSGVFCFYSATENFFDDQEVLLLQEAAGDISFALEVFEKEKLRREAEAQLIQNEVRLKKAQSIAHIGHWELDLATGMGLWSEETCRIYGLHPDDNKQSFEVWVAFLHPDDKDFVLKLVEEQRRTISDGSFDHRILRRDGTTRHIHFESKFEFNLSGKSIGLYGIVHDITEQKLAEQKLKESEARLNEAQTIAKVGSFEIDMVNNLTTWSDEQFNLLGYKRGEVEPSSELFFSMVHPEDLERVTRNFNDTFVTLINSSTSFRIISRDGTVKYIFCQWKFELDHQQKPLRLYGIVQDITERKQAEQEIIKLNQELEKRVEQRTAELMEAYQQLESFSYTVSHDLRSPLQVIGGYADILSKKYEHTLNEDAKTLLTGVKDNIRQMGQLIADILNFSRLSRTALVKKPVDLKAVMQAVINELRLADKNSIAEIKLQNLKPVNCDEGLLHQVCINLVSNALKYSKKVKSPVIEIGLQKMNGEDVFFVKDNGAGFDMKYANKLFTAFNRLHSASEFEGTGVGLALVHSIITKHGGRIWAEGKEGEGATFYFTLPDGD